MYKRPLFLVGDLKLNSLYNSKSSPVTNLFNLRFQHTIFPLINKPTTVIKTSARAIGHIMTNTFLQAEVSSAIMKT